MTPFTRSLQSLALKLDLEHELADLTPGDSFARLHKLADRASVAAELRAFSAGEITRLRTLAKSGVAHSTHINRFVEELLFAHLVGSMAYRYTGPKPKIHHWLPVAYVKHFARGLNGKGRACSVYQLTWESGEGMERQVADSHFTHGVDATGSGFYHLAMENFFSRLEEGYGTEFQNQGVKTTDMFSLISFAAFFVVQSVRNPHPEHQFTLRTIEGTVTALGAQLEALPPVTARAVEAPKGKPMTFTPYVPPRLRVLADGSLVMVFGLSSKGALTLSTRPLSVAAAQAAVADARRSMIAHARRSQTAVFGVRHSDPLF